MITNFKMFENMDEPKVGDYVQIYANYFEVDDRNFFAENIGKIITITGSEGYPISVQFDTTFPTRSQFVGTFTEFDKSEIKNFAPDIETLKMKIDSKKYNL